ncbi:hypothetical protein BAE44_0014292 [Dichanthelium oligosanthes]|uniref:F-box domain-containing protein n=1 Tax=Dichanthelium oligosanthes TaxID=888268 RepID=A0A1E5VHT0_9POAL|nr:hypothetical protein BAE44_0014292 [Dichanthelium oligosanthes]
MASPARPVLPRIEPAASPRQPAALTDHLLEEIFLRVASWADLARASIACGSFRRLITDPIFLRRYRSLHPSLFLGFVDMPRPVRRCLEAPASPRRPAALADDLLEEILLRVACPADLARASAACTSFRRLVTDATFLRRYRTLHPPLLLGVIETVSSGFQPAEAPHPNATTARSIARPAAGFSFDYLPPTRWDWMPWDACDVRDGRVLLKSTPIVCRGVYFPHLAVCDPLSRRYRLLPDIPDDLLASVPVQQQFFPSFEAFLVPFGEEEDGTSFRVIGRAHCAIKSVVFVFSSGSGLWSVGTMWDDLNLGGSILLCRCYAYGNVYWKVMRANKLFKLDINRMDFSTVDLPPHYDERDVIIVEAGKGRVGVFSHIKFGMSVYHAIQQKESKIADGCQSEIVTHLPAQYDFCMVGAAEGYVFFVGFPKDRRVDPASFSLQVKTLKIEMTLDVPKSSIPFLPSPAPGGSQAMASRAGRILPGLSRASALCVSSRRLISDPSVIRRYSSINPPVLLGFLSSAGFQPAEAPHPSAAVARAVARAADFSFNYIPRATKLHRWHPCDVRDGHVLVDCRRFTEGDDGEESLSWDLAVCDPLSRRYLLLPPITDDLLASVELQNQNMFSSGALFIPSGDMEEETQFSVMCWMHSETKLVVFFFSSGSGHWSVGTSTSWDDLGLHEEVDSLGSCQCAYGCFYWKVNYTNKLLKLDMSTTEFSAYDLPPDHVDGDIVIVESGEGKVGMFSQLAAGTSVDYYTFLQNGTEKSYEWHMKSGITLPAQYTSEFYISGPAEGYIFLAGTPKEQDVVHSAFFSLEIKSFKIDREQEMASPPQQTATLTDDLLEEIFLRIASPADLARASTACASFRRLIAGRTVLRRYRSLHPPLLLGFLDPGLGGGFQPAEAPHPNAPAARAAGFSFDYLPRTRECRWYPRDVRDGRVLLYCNPRKVQKQHVRFFEAFLVPSGAEQGEALFRVLGRACCMIKMVVVIFSTVSGHWDVGTSTSWDAISLRAQPVAEGLMLRWPSYAYGCFSWKVYSRNKLLKLNVNRMELSIIHIPPDHAERNVVIVETEEGRLGMSSKLSHVNHETSLYYAIKNSEGESSNEWKTANTKTNGACIWACMCILDGRLDSPAERAYAYAERSM